MFNDFYKNKKVLVTGATGFKGSWLSIWLKLFGAEVLGYALKPDTEPSMFESLNIGKKIKIVFADILDKQSLQTAFDEFRPEIVFHLAAQPLVRRSYNEPFLTYETNVIGTLNVLLAAKNSGSVKAFVNVTTDKCYENNETGAAFKEEDPLGGYDMYSSSKACVEILSSSFRRSFLTKRSEDESGFALATARAGNVIGGGDWAQDRLIPDCIKAINSGKPVELRNPCAVRPWQHVLEPLSGYLLLGQKLFENGDAYAQAFNFGPEKDSVLTVHEVANNVVDCYGKGCVVVKENNSLHEAGLLMLDIEKSKKILGWAPCLTPQEALRETVEWYRRFYDGDGESMYDFTLSQISEYIALCMERY